MCTCALLLAQRYLFADHPLAGEVFPTDDVHPQRATPRRAVQAQLVVHTG
jgi:hypothetical protein